MLSVINSFWTRESKILRFITQITADTRDTETMRLRYRIAFPPPRKPYRIRLLFTHKNGCGGAISVTEWSCARLCRSLKRRVTIGRMFILYQIAFRDAMKSYRVFWHDVTAAILVSQNNETETMLVSQRGPWKLHSFLTQTRSFVLINLHRCWPREWKHSLGYSVNIPTIA